jgi:hypothetical protein
VHETFSLSLSLFLSLFLSLSLSLSKQPARVDRRYVSPVIQRAISTRTVDAVSCFTEVSCLFVGISGVDLGLLDPTADMLWGQIIMSTVQVHRALSCFVDIFVLIGFIVCLLTFW